MKMPSTWSLIVALVTMPSFALGSPPSAPNVHAARRGSPWVNLLDGRTLPSSDEGPEELRDAIGRGIAIPLGLAAADIDLDGGAELIAAYGYGKGGMLAIYSGLADRFAVGQAMARVSLVKLSDRPEYLAAGDLDADGRPDIAFAARGSHVLWLLAGDGRGAFAPARSVSLHGSLTALASGEVNRRDGLTDLVAAVTDDGTSVLQVFQSRRGALNANPQAFSVPGEIRGIALGAFDDDPARDIVAATDERLLIVHGNDGVVGTPELIPLSHGLAAFAAGRFSAQTDRWTSDLALLGVDGVLRLMIPVADKAGHIALDEAWSRQVLPAPARAADVLLLPGNVSSLPGDDIVLLDRVRRQIQILPGALATGGDVATSAGRREIVPAVLDAGTVPAAVLVRRLNDDAVDDVILLAEGSIGPQFVVSAPVSVFTVDSTADTSDAALGNGICADSLARCTLRAAIEEANISAGADSIVFNIGTGTPTIAVTSDLPAISDAVTISGDTGGATRVELNGANAGPGANTGLELSSTGGTGGSIAVRAMVVNRFDGPGLLVRAPNSVVENCYLGTDSAGGGTVTGNRQGVTVQGTMSGGSVIGGTTAASRNIISHNQQEGIGLTGTGTGNVLVSGNFIGTDAAGTSALGNGTDGVVISGNAHDNTIGGAVASPGSPPGNIISGNTGDGVEINGPSTLANLVQGNLVGTSVSGTSALGNVQNGALLAGSCNGNTVGGSAPSLRNVLSGNSGATSDGLELNGGNTVSNNVEGNFIGLDISGSSALPNAEDGVLITNGSRDNLIGGVTASPGTGLGNVIAGNSRDGVRIVGAQASPNTIRGNLIGTAVSGTAAVPNVGNGVTLSAVGGVTIGGSAAGARNVVSGNSGAASQGIEITGSGASNNVVQGNFIGTDVSGTSSLGNGANGVRVVATSGGATGNMIGGSASTTGDAPGNVISGNGANGVLLTGSAVSGTSVAGNVIRENGAVGIFITSGSDANSIGGLAGAVAGSCTALCNNVSGNAAAGVALDSATSAGNSVRANSIDVNGGLGIDLGTTGVTPNDVGDGDSGPNLQQNFPVIGAAVWNGVNTAVSGSLNGAANTTLTIDAYSSLASDPSGNGEGRRWYGATTCLTDGSGNCTWSVLTPQGSFLAATATDPSGNTSEFSATFANPGEASRPGQELTAQRDVATTVRVFYAPGCGATDHVIYRGLAGPGAIAGPLVWTAASCGLGDSGIAVFDPGTPPAGEFFYFVIVAQDATREGPYGRSTTGVERPEAIGVGACDLPRGLSSPCP